MHTVAFLPDEAWPKITRSLRSKPVHVAQSHPALLELNRQLPAQPPDEVPAMCLYSIEPFEKKSGIGDQNGLTACRNYHRHLLQEFALCARAALELLRKSPRKDRERASAKGQLRAE